MKALVWASEHVLIGVYGSPNPIVIAQMMCAHL